MEKTTGASPFPVAQCARVHLFVTLYLDLPVYIYVGNNKLPLAGLKSPRLHCKFCAHYRAARRLFATHKNRIIQIAESRGKNPPITVRAPTQNGINLKQSYLDKRVVREVRRKKLAHTYEKHFWARLSQKMQFYFFPFLSKLEVYNPDLLNMSIFDGIVL